jgi:activator of Hsp90 ATPase-like protein
MELAGMKGNNNYNTLKNYLMKQDFTTSIQVDQTPAEAFEAINDVRAWWPGEIEGNTKKLDDEFTYRYKRFHYSKQKLVEVVPGKKVVWLVTDSNLNFVENKAEWTGTKIIFDISEKNNKTQVRFTHQGLVPAYECFDSCSNAWSDIVKNGLRNLIAKGKGQADLEKA